MLIMLRNTSLSQPASPQRGLTDLSGNAAGSAQPQCKQLSSSNYTLSFPYHVMLLVTGP